MLLQDYKHGFGELSAEFWFGNDYIHRLTSSEPGAGVTLRQGPILSKNEEVKWVFRRKIGEETKVWEFMFNYELELTNVLISSSNFPLIIISFQWKYSALASGWS